MKSELSERQDTPPGDSRFAIASGGASSVRDILVILLVAWATRILFMLIVPPEARSIDTYSWERVGRILMAGGNPYKATSMLNWPPLWLQAIDLMTRTATFLDIPFFRVLQITLMAIESIVLILTYKLIRTVSPEAAARKIVLVGLALNPAAILLVCQHGNFDVLVALWLVLFLGSLLRYDRKGEEAQWLLACLFLGLGILTKTVPLVLTPFLAGGFRRLSGPTRFLGLTLLLGPVALGMSILYVLAPADIAAKVLAYRSSAGWFGFSGLIHLARLDSLEGAFDLLFYVLLAATLLGLTHLYWRRRSLGPRETVLGAALVLTAIPTLGPGYAPQYLYWFLPLWVASFAFLPGRWRWVLAIFGVICAATYLVEYALFPSHGMFLVQMIRSGSLTAQADTLSHWSQTGSTRAGQTLVRLPLFFAYLALLCSGLRIFVGGLRSSSSTPTSAGRPDPTSS